jgi:hypothetical protein
MITGIHHVFSEARGKSSLSRSSLGVKSKRVTISPPGLLNPREFILLFVIKNLDLDG